MPRLLNVPYVNFVKGLNTESNELTGAEGTSTDELNCELQRNGHRTRRQGINFEAGTSVIPVPSGTPNVPFGGVVNIGEWENAGGTAGLTYSVVKEGTQLRFFNKSYEDWSDPDAQLKDSTGTIVVVLLRPFQRPNGKGISNAGVQVTSIKGRLVVTSPELNAFYVDLSATGDVTSTQINFRERDYEYLVSDPNTLLTAEPWTSTQNNGRRMYDSINSGWWYYSGGVRDSSSPLYSYRIAKRQYPPLVLPWYVGKDSNELYDQSEFVKVEKTEGTGLIGNGKHIVGVYNQIRTPFIPGIGTYVNSREDSRFSCCSSFGERVFFSGMDSQKRGSRVYFTQVLIQMENIGNLYAVNDPTSEDFSDALATDGGFIELQGAYNIKRLHPLGTKLFVFAENGVWAITGVEDRFDPTNFVVDKVFDIGLEAPGSFVAVEDIPFWWSKEGIYTISSDQLGEPRPADISRNTIQTFFNNISGEARSTVQGVADQIEKKIFWLYGDKDRAENYRFNNVLILDLNLNAFYPWRIEDSSSNRVDIVGLDFYTAKNSQETVFDVTDDLLSEVLDSEGDQVIVSKKSSISGERSRLKFLCNVDVGNTDGTGQLQWAELRDVSFLDWGETNYSSYIETKVENMGDLSVDKTAPYLITYSGVTETGWELNAQGSYDMVRPSSLLASIYWDFRTTSSGGTQQAYRFPRIPVPDVTDLDTFGYPEEILQTRLALRGTGTHLKLRYESESGKDFDIVGWNLIGAANDGF